MVILGIDPGLRMSGFCILACEQGRVGMIDCGVLPLPASKPLVDRVGLFNDFFAQKMVPAGVTHVALETSFLGKNASNFLKLGYLRGVLYALAYQYKLDVLEFAPREVKQAVTGFGGAEKDQVARVVMRLFPSMSVPKTFDVTDAVAVALCGVWRARLDLRTVGVEKRFF